MGRLAPALGIFPVQNATPVLLFHCVPITTVQSPIFPPLCVGSLADDKDQT